MSIHPENMKIKSVSTLLFTAVSGLFLIAFTVIPVPDWELEEITKKEIVLETFIIEQYDLSPPDPIDTDFTTPTESAEEIVIDEEPPKQTVEVSSKELLNNFGELTYSDITLDNTDTRNAAQTVDIDRLDITGQEQTERVLATDIDLSEELIQRSTTSNRPASLVANIEGTRSSVSNSRTIAYDGSLEGLTFDDLGSPRGTLRASIGEGELSLEASGSTTPSLALTSGNGDIMIPLDQLLQWILANQAPLDPGIRSMFQFRSPSISAKTKTIIDDTPSELQFMYTASNREIKIALINERDENIYYFIDPGFQQRAQHFQKGTISRNDNNLIDLVENEDFSSVSDEALTFYKLFLLWWQQEKEKME